MSARPPLPGVAGFIEPPGLKITFTIEMWPASGDIRTNCHPPNANAYQVLQGVLGAALGLTQSLAHAASMIVRPGGEKEKNS